MRKQEVIEAFNQGRTIRLTRGIWSYSQRDRKIAKSVEEIEEFYSWAQAVDVTVNKDGIIDLIGASYCDMF